MSGNLWMFSDMLDDEDIEMQKHDFITLYQGADYYGLGLPCCTCAATFLNAMPMSEFTPAPISRSVVWQITSFVLCAEQLITILINSISPVICPSRMHISGLQILFAHHYLRHTLVISASITASL